MGVDGLDTRKIKQPSTDLIKLRILNAWVLINETIIANSNKKTGIIMYYGHFTWDNNMDLARNNKDNSSNSTELQIYYILITK